MDQDHNLVVRGLQTTLDLVQASTTMPWQKGFLANWKDAVGSSGNLLGSAFGNPLATLVTAGALSLLTKRVKSLFGWVGKLFNPFGMFNLQTRNLATNSRGAAGGVRKFATTLGKTLRPVLGRVGSVLGRFSLKALRFAQRTLIRVVVPALVTVGRALLAAFANNPVGAAIVGIGLLITGGVAAWKSDLFGFKTWTKNLWSGIKDGFVKARKGIFVFWDQHKPRLDGVLAKWNTFTPDNNPNFVLPPVMAGEPQEGLRVSGGTKETQERLRSFLAPRIDNAQSEASPGGTAVTLAEWEPLAAELERINRGLTEINNRPITLSATLNGREIIRLVRTIKSNLGS